MLDVVSYKNLMILLYLDVRDVVARVVHIEPFPESKTLKIPTPKINNGGYRVRPHHPSDQIVIFLQK
jgi:hypothetical protein